MSERNNDTDISKQRRGHSSRTSDIYQLGISQQAPGGGTHGQAVSPQPSAVAAMVWRGFSVAERFYTRGWFRLSSRFQPVGRFWPSGRFSPAEVVLAKQRVLASSRF